jgi:hypothetical protein
MLIEGQKEDIADCWLLFSSRARRSRIFTAGDTGKDLFGLVPRLLWGECAMSPERQSARRKAAPPAGAIFDEVGGGAVGVPAHAKAGKLVVADDAPDILASKTVHKALCDPGHAAILRSRHVGTASAPNFNARNLGEMLRNQNRS